MYMRSSGSMLRSALLLTLANLAMRGVTMLFQVYLSGAVGAVGVGLLQLIMTVHSFAVTVGTSGIRVAAMYLSAEEYGLRRFGGIRQAMAWCIGAGLALSTLVGAAMSLGAEFLALNWIQDLRAVASLRLLGLTLPLTCLSTILAGYFTACGQIHRLVAVEIADRVASVGLTVWLLQRGVTGDLSHACVSIVGGGALASLGSVAVLLGMLLRDLRRYGPAGESLSMGKRLVRLCVPLALNEYLRSGLGTLEQFLIPRGLSQAAGSKEKALASYGIIHGMVFPVLMFPSTVLYSVADLLVPELARCRAEQNRRRMTHLTGTCLRMGLLYAGTVAGLLYVLAVPLGQLLYHRQAAGEYLRLFAPLVLMLYMDCIVDGMHKGLGQQVYCVRVNTLTSLMDVVLLFFLLPRYGIGGYFFSFVLTHAVNFYLSIRKLLSLTGHMPTLGFPVLTGLCVCAAAAVTGFFVPTVCRWSAVFWTGGIYLALLGLLLLLSGAWRQEDTRWLRRNLKPNEPNSGLN